MSSSRSRTHCAKQQIDALIRRHAPGVLFDQHHGSCRLITAIRARTSWLAVSANHGQLVPESVEPILTACARMAKVQRHWSRSPESWMRTGGAVEQFRSLVHHLFDQFPVPHFMTSVWMFSDVAPWMLKLYLHLAAGNSIRRFHWPVPVQLSKRMARWFMQAPDDMSPGSAYRWARVRSLGGSDQLARTLSMTTPLMIPTAADAFWDSVTQFLIRESDNLTRTECVRIVEFIDSQRFAPGWRTWGTCPGELANPEESPLQPDFTMRGCTLMSLRRHMTHWRTELAEKLSLTPPRSYEWRPSSIRSFHTIQNGSSWTVRELLCANDIRVEASVMKHCVASYISACARRETTIWSLSRNSYKGQVRTLTIEVDPFARRIRQARGKHNIQPMGAPLEVLKKWAQKEELVWQECC